MEPRLVPEEKFCKDCSQVKPCTAFSPQRRNKDGLATYCKPCQAIRTKASRDAKLSKYREADRTRKDTKRKANLDAAHEADKLKRSSEAYKKYQAEYRKKNARKNADRVLARNAYIKGVTIETVDRDILYTRDRGLCQLCSKPVAVEEFTVDHIYPLSKGGEHSYANTQIAHKSCNSSKGATVIERSNTMRSIILIGAC